MVLVFASPFIFSPACYDCSSIFFPSMLWPLIYFFPQHVMTAHLFFFPACYDCSSIFFPSMLWLLIYFFSQHVMTAHLFYFPACYDHSSIYFFPACYDRSSSFACSFWYNMTGGCQPGVDIYNDRLYNYTLIGCRKICGYV